MKIKAIKKNVNAGTDYYRIAQPEWAEIMTELILFVTRVGEAAQNDSDMRSVIFDPEPSLPAGRRGRNSVFSYACGLIHQQTSKVRDFSEAQLDAVEIILSVVGSKTYEIERIG